MRGRISPLFTVLALLFRCQRRVGAPFANLSPESEAVLQPASDAREISVRSRRADLRAVKMEMLPGRHLRIDEQTGGDGEGRACGGFGQSFDRERARQAHLAAEDAPNGLLGPGELTRPARKHDALAGGRTAPGPRQPVPQHFQRLLEAGTDHAHEMRPWRMRRRLAVLARLVVGKNLTLVRRRSDRRAVMGLQTFRV